MVIAVSHLNRLQSLGSIAWFRTVISRRPGIITRFVPLTMTRKSRTVARVITRRPGIVARTVALTIMRLLGAIVMVISMTIIAWSVRRPGIVARTIALTITRLLGTIVTVIPMIIIVRRLRIVSWTVPGSVAVVGWMMMDYMNLLYYLIMLMVMLCLVWFSGWQRWFISWAVFRRLWCWWICWVFQWWWWLIFRRF